MGKSYILRCELFCGHMWHIDFGGFGKPGERPGAVTAFRAKFPEFNMDAETGEMTRGFAKKRFPNKPPLAIVQQIIDHLLHGKTGQVSNSNFEKSGSSCGTYMWTITLVH